MVENTELSNSESVTRKIAETPDENVGTEEGIAFDDLTIPGDYSDYDILKEENETISKNDDVWVKTKKYMDRRRWELSGIYTVFTAVMVIYHYVERICRILFTPNFLYNICNHV